MGERIEFKTGDQFEHSNPDSPTVVVTRLDDGSWTRRSRASGQFAAGVGPGRSMGHDTADDWVRYLIEFAGFVKIE